MKKNIIASVFSLAILFTFASVVQADTHTNKKPPITENNPTKPFVIENPLKCGQNCTINDLLKTLVNEILLPIASIIAVLSFIYSGFMYVMAKGNENEIKRAHRALLYSAIGTAILLGAWSIVNVVSNTVDKLTV